MTALKGRSVLIAGASGGLGTALATECHRREGILTLVARRQAGLEAVATPGTRHALDLRDPNACQRAVDAAVEHTGGLDVVVNAVGVVAFGSVIELSIDTMEELFLTNTFVPIMLAKAALPVIRPGGTIVNISGMIAERNISGLAAYGASKAALRSFDQALADETRRTEVRILDVRPPHTDTDLAGRAIEGIAPRLGAGLPAAHVARVICDAIETGVDDLPAGAF